MPVNIYVCKERTRSQAPLVKSMMRDKKERRNLEGKKRGLYSRGEGVGWVGWQ